MRWIHLSLFLAASLAFSAGPSLAAPEGDAASKAFAFDLENPPFETLLEKAKAAKKLVWIDFYLPG